MGERRHEPRRPFWPVRNSGQLLLIAAAGVVLVASVAQTATEGVQDDRIAVAFGVLIAFGEVLRLNLPGDRESAPIGIAGALAYALLIQVGGEQVHTSAEQVITITAIGMIVGALPHLAVGRPAKVSSMATRLLCVAAVAFIYRPLAGSRAITSHWGLAFSLMTSLVLLALLLEAVLTALMRVEEQRARFKVALVDEMRVQLPLGAAVGASALLIAFAAETMGLAALAVFTAPLLLTQVAFRRYAGIRATYLQTVRALAKVTEIGGYVEPGHSERVSKLAVAVGRELGIHEPELLELEYAALMHDIGQLSLHDPIPGGATVLAAPHDQQRIAELGAEVIEKAQVLGSVAEIVRRQNEPYRGIEVAHEGRRGRHAAPPASAGPSGPPMGSRIIKAANAFDDLVGSSLDPDRSAAAVEQLRLDTVSEYDPDAIEALSRVVNRRSVIQL
ncbi:MAG TPA: HD domain-containing phosphohydrolase [Streptosporangiaceae bacterium]|nr:HD domain-containing phosphohydrolase [Streptosporangiaceae bacterium]